MHRYLTLALLILCSLPSTGLTEVTSFRQAKVELRESVYHDQNRSDEGSFYCGCDWEWASASGGRINLESCGYQVRKQEHRAQRIEWEHVVPAWVMGHQRQCWQDGGRDNCTDNDPVFEVMEADMHNLVPAIGEVNADRSNYSFGMLPDTDRQHGACDFEVDFGERTVEPRNEIRGQIARTYFYIHDRYGLRMSRQQQRLLMAWDRQFPVTDWERIRDERIAQVMGHHNPFVTGERSWQHGHKNSAEGLVSWLGQESMQDGIQSAQAVQEVRGNRNSKVYHLSDGCPSYDQVSQKNRVSFSSEAEALAAGYRKAGNCR